MRKRRFIIKQYYNSTEIRHEVGLISGSGSFLYREEGPNIKKKFRFVLKYQSICTNQRCSMEVRFCTFSYSLNVNEGLPGDFGDLLPK